MAYLHPYVMVCLCRLTIGLVMLGLKGAGLVAAVLYNCFTSIAVAKEFTRRYLWPYLPFLGKRPEDKFADLVGKVILQVYKWWWCGSNLHYDCGVSCICTMAMCTSSGSTRASCLFADESLCWFAMIVATSKLLHRAKVSEL